MDIKDMIIIFKLLKEKKINNFLCKSAIDFLMKDSEFDYMNYFIKNCITQNKLSDIVLDVISQNEELAKDNNSKNVNMLVLKVLSIVGKGVDYDKIKLIVLVQLDIRKRILNKINSNSLQTIDLKLVNLKYQSIVLENH